MHSRSHITNFVEGSLLICYVSKIQRLNKFNYQNLMLIDDRDISSRTITRL